jgi:hypothetical protein
MGTRRAGGYAGDPRWIEARYDGTCAKCSGPVKVGERALWYPNGRKLYCAPCGEPAHARFHAEVADELAYNGQSW